LCNSVWLASSVVDLRTPGFQICCFKCKLYRYVVDNHRDTIVAGVERSHGEASAALAAKESALLHDVSALRGRGVSLAHNRPLF
jgi:hypothetical protein